jgi:hypothetical protein
VFLKYKSKEELESLFYDHISINLFSKNYIDKYYHHRLYKLIEALLITVDLRDNNLLFDIKPRLSNIDKIDYNRSVYNYEDIISLIGIISNCNIANSFDFKYLYNLSDLDVLIDFYFIIKNSNELGYLDVDCFDFNQRVLYNPINLEPIIDYFTSIGINRDELYSNSIKINEESLSLHNFNKSLLNKLLFTI